MMKPVKKKGNKAVTVVIILLSIVAFFGFWGFVISSIVGGLEGNDINKIATGPTIDVIHVEGVIGEQASLFSEPSYNHKWTIEQIDGLMASENNKAIVLYVNSPGGGVYESDELYLKLKEYKEKTGRPVYAYMAQMAASGGYYVCMAADKVYANRMSITGSIGVIMSTVDTTELQKKIGIKTENIVSGKNKAMGNPLTQEQRKILQGMINETYNIFVGIVSENRKISLEATKKIADGRIYTATQAKELKLIDALGNFDTAVEDLKKTHNLMDCEVSELVNESTFWDTLLGTVSKDMKLFNQFESIKTYIHDNDGGKLMYYYAQ